MNQQKIFGVVFAIRELEGRPESKKKHNCVVAEFNPGPDQPGPLHEPIDTGCGSRQQTISNINDQATAMITHALKVGNPKAGVSQ